MSEISHSDELVTKQDLSNFYQGILPYLGGMPDVVGGGFAPVGTIIAFMGTTAPQDYLSCNGATYNIADYPQLTAFFAAQFGSVNKFGGDGVTTFKVPDLRGEFLRGTGTNGHSGQGSGLNVGTHQDATNHNMVLGSYQGKWIGTGNTNATSDTLPNNFDSKVNNAAMFFSGMGNIETSSWVQGSQYAAKYTSRPTNTSVLYCIKAIESGQVYSTEERKIGTWINGKPIYQKTIDCGALPNVSMKDVAHGIENLGRVIDIFGTSKHTSGNNVPIPHPYPKANNAIGVVSLWADATNIHMDTNSDLRSYAETYVTIQYTKTTD